MSANGFAVHVTRLLLRSPRNQLLFALASTVIYAVLFALLLQLDAVLGYIIVAVIWVIFALQVGAGVITTHVATINFRQVIQALIPQAGYAITQSLVAVAALPISVLILWLSYEIHVLLSLLVIPLVFVVLLLVVAPAILSIVAAVLGDRELYPRAAWEAMRGRFVVVFSSAIFLLIIAAIVASACSLAVLLGLAGLEQLHLPLGALTIPLTAAVITALSAWQCSVFGLAGWQALGGHVPTEIAGVEHAIEASEKFASEQAPAQVWVPGTSWRVQLTAGSSWGAWVEVSSALQRVIGVELTWQAGERPRLLTCDTEGAWLEWPVESEPHHFAVVSASPGWTWIQLVSQDVEPQSFDVKTFLPPTNV